MSELLKQARELARGVVQGFRGSTDERVGPPAVNLAHAVIALADSLESHIALHPAHGEPTAESAAQRFSGAVTEILVDYGCADEVDGLCFETQTQWLRSRLLELVAARNAVNVLRTCVRDDIVVVEASEALRAYDVVKAAG